MSKSGNETLELIAEIRQERSSGRIGKRFKDDYFALDLLRILYDDTVESYVKVELLISLEEYGHLGITEESVDQIVTSLLDIHHQIVDKGENWTVNCQILTTCTSLIIQCDQLRSQLCDGIIRELVTIVTSRVNQPDSQRLRACACQCLLHIEQFQPGVLFCYHDDISQLSRQERSHVFQDYALLSATILESVPQDGDYADTITTANKQGIQKQMSYEPQDIRQTAAYFVENLPLFTRSGTLRVIQSLTKLAKRLPQVSPMIFKPTMLHQMSTMSCVVFHTVLYLQSEFETEILSSREEVDLLQRLCIMCDHPSLNQLHRLLAIQWAQQYNMDNNGHVEIHKSIIENERSRFYPNVFDSVDCQLGKLCMTSLLGDTSNDADGIETSILLGSLGCLHKIVWHTGSGMAARALFKALYYIYTKHHNQSFSKDIQRFVRGLISEFAHFIPHSIDFADCVHEIGTDDEVFVDTLRLLHQQVVIATEEQIYHSYQFYLQIMKKAASRKEINQKPALKFLSYLVKNASSVTDSSWKLGHRILDICRIIIMHHGTDECFIELGDLLHEMMCSYNDTDVQDKARFYYALITRSTDSKVHSVLRSNLQDVESMNQAITSLLPGSTDKQSLAKIIKLDQPVFTWKRVSVTTCINEECKSMLNTERTTEQITEPNTIEQYAEIISKLDVLLELKCQLELNSDSDMERTHAISIHVEPTPVYQPVKSKHIACLAKLERRDVFIKLRPQLPLPQYIHCNVTFACDNKLTYTHSLPPVEVEFYQLMMKLPWTPSTYHHLQYNDLWQWVLNRTIDDRKGIESVKLFQVSQQQFKMIYEKKLAQFEYESHAGKGLDGTGNYRLAIFLPPQYHVLLKCEPQGEDCVVVSIVTDLWTLLPHIDRYLETVFS